MIHSKKSPGTSSCLTVSMALICSIFFLLPGCVSGLNFTKPSSRKPAVVEKSTSKSAATAVHFGFKDIRVPRELKIINDKSFVAATPGYRSGVLTLKGMVDTASLFHFFSVNMKQDHWQVVSQIKSPGLIIMVFQKPAKCAVITIRDDFSTRVEIGVAPTLNTAISHGEDFLESDLVQ